MENQECKACETEIQSETKETEIQAEKKFESVLSAQTKTKEYLIFAICFAIMTVSFVFSKISGGIFEIFKGLIPAICMIVATSGLLAGIKAKNPQKLSKAIKKASAYDGYLYVVYSAITTGIILLYVGAMVLVGIITYNNNNTMGELIKILLIVSVIFLIPMIIVGRIAAIYEQRRKYFKALSEYNLSGEYDLSKYKIKKVPVFWSYLLGGWNLVLGIISFVSSLLIKLSLDAVMGYVRSLEFLEDISFLEGILDSVAEFVSSSTLSGIILGISNIILGGYYFFSAKWMQNVDKAICDAK